MAITLASPLHTLNGIGARVAEKFARLNLFKVEDLLYHFPLRYQDRTRINSIAQSRPGQEVQLFVEVSHSEVTFGRKRMLLVHAHDASGMLCLRFFAFSAAMKEQFPPGQKVLVYGPLQSGKHYPELLHPEFQIVQGNQPILDKGSTPIYALTEGISQKLMRKAVKQALDLMQQNKQQELLHDDFIEKLQLPDLKQAIYAVHYPDPKNLLEGQLKANDPYRKRLVIEEILAHQLKQQQGSQKVFSQPAHKLQSKADVIADFYQRLPFQPTAAQLRVIAEIEQDLQRDKPMLRLLQGDVGAGKTLVAAVAALNAIANGFQVALMAPTEILAEQHYHSFIQWFSPFRIHCALLKGKMKASEKQQLLQQLQQGEIAFVVGTHALIQQDVAFHKLGLVIIDEQHRFGVLQRKALIEKGAYKGRIAHQLMMTATPIPRTLAMVSYADLQVSVIDELPKGRKPVMTFALEQSRRQEILQKIRQHCQKGQQLYWVCTLIEESEMLQKQTAEETFELLQNALPELKVALIHGRMKSEQKENIMQQFKQGAVQILVSTTVIEVGVNVPNATLMIIEDADRLGLAQLHQLRGRVGRGAQQSYCALLYQAPLSDSGKERLGIMRASNDGFEIAEKDLQLRGPGEYMGTRQTGQLQFKIANLQSDQQWIELCRQHLDTALKPDMDPDLLINRWLNLQEELINV